jgi:hypothetical protein
VDLLLAAILALALTPTLGVLFAALAEGRAPELPRAVPPFSADALAGGVSLLLAGLALALLPWPLHPAAGRAWIGQPLLVWAAVEGAFLAPLVPALAGATPLAARTALRDAQIGAAGRCVVWLAASGALWGGFGWATADWPGRVLLGLAGVLALPAAAGIGPFATELSLSMAGAEEGLDEATVRLLRFARAARGGALAAVLVLAMLPLTAAAAPAGLALALATLAVLAVVIRRAAVGLPRMTLPAALRWCWWRALPLAVGGMVYLLLMQI